MSLIGLTLDHVITIERNRAASGVPLVVRDKSFDRAKLIRRIVEYCLGGGHNPAASDPPTALVCSHKYTGAMQLMTAINPLLPPKMRGIMLTSRTQPERIGALTFSSYGALQQAGFDTDAFDFVVIDAHMPREFTRSRGLFARLEPMFTVLILSKPMYEQGELEHWPQLEPAFMVERQRTQQTPPDA